MTATSPAATKGGWKEVPDRTRPREAGPSVAGRLAGLLAFVESAPGAYLLIALLQLKVIWADWRLRDLTIGDTSSYIQSAVRWAEGWRVDILWSPLYTAYFGTALLLTGDAPTATWLHRAIIVFAATLLVLAALRQLLPPLAAWSIAAWWCIMEVGFNVRREVHLFAALPLLLAIVLVMKVHGVWGRALALAVFCGAAVLIRNEYAVAALLFGAACGWWELKHLLRLPTGRWAYLRRQICIYAVPLAVVAVLVVLTYERSTIKFPELIAHSEPKHTLNICQVYAMGYQQRYSDWQANPWLACPELMQRQFGAPLPSLTATLRSNPAAMIEHFWWNVELAPSGLQVALFNAMSGSITADYEPVPIDRTIIPILSVLLVAVNVIGIGLFLSRRGRWARQQVMASAWGWLALLANVVITALVIPVERPRPEYMYPLLFFIMVTTGWSLTLLATLLPLGPKQRVLVPLVMLGLLVVAPSFYDNPEHVRPRRLFEEYQRLRPFAALVENPSTMFLKGGYAGELTGYLARGKSRLFSYDLLGEWDKKQPLEAFLAQRRINLFFVDRLIFGSLQLVGPAQQLLTDPESVGWKLIGQQNSDEDWWMLLQRQDGSAAPGQPGRAPVAAPVVVVPQPAPQVHEDIAPVQAADGLLIGNGWYPPETESSELFRRLGSGAEIVLTAPGGASRNLQVDLDLQADPAGRAVSFEVFDDSGSRGATPLVAGRQQVLVPVATEPGKSMILRLRLVETATSAPVSPQTLGLRVFGLKWVAP